MVSISESFGPFCGDLVYTAEFGLPDLDEIGSSSTPLAYDVINGDFTIDTDDGSLVDLVIPYKLTAQFATGGY